VDDGVEHGRKRRRVIGDAERLEPGVTDHLVPIGWPIFSH
jgi:hypothetical protein